MYVMHSILTSHNLFHLRRTVAAKRLGGMQGKVTKTQRTHDLEEGLRRGWGFIILNMNFK